MSAQFISLQQAAKLAGKSVQTIRRAIKGKKLIAKRQKTPQGFNYLVEKESLVEAFRLEGKVMQEAVQSTETDSAETTSAVSTEKSEQFEKAIGTVQKQYGELKDVFNTFNKTMSTLIEHNNQERDNFYRLMKTFQDRVVMLEDHVRDLNDKSNKKWYQLWK